MRNLDDYARTVCKAESEYKNSAAGLFRKLLEKAIVPNGQPALADAIDGFARLLDDLAVKNEEFGDPPNGEGAGRAKALADDQRRTAREVRSIAEATRTTESANVKQMLTDLKQTLLGGATRETEVLQKYPTPELDSAKRAIPGCVDSEPAPS
ncbi:hypothetical protein [Nocardia sp. NPDC052566]|uniref:hypothetical protein n=1 Tax=Nocardia sp. NPDC052566 TaxID=3364330 RepID=UPI0037C56AFB